MRKNSYKDKMKLGDYPLYCDICGMKSWYSQSKVLDKYTGRGGLLVCRTCYDSIDYGLVPYKVEPEETPDITRNNHYAANPADVPQDVQNIDLSTQDPMSAVPQFNWEDLDTQVWGQWNLPWGS